MVDYDKVILVKKSYVVGLVVDVKDSIELRNLLKLVISLLKELYIDWICFFCIILKQEMTNI